MTKLPLVAIDDGYAQIKVFGDNPHGGAPIRKVFRTSARAGRHGLSTMRGEATDAYRTEEGDDFTISPSIVGENTQFDSFHVSTMNRVLVMHGLTYAGYDGMEVDLTTGLPVADYFRSTGIDQNKIDAKIANLKKGVERVGSKLDLPVISRVDVGCQALAAWLDYMYDDDLKQVRDPKKTVAIVDIGGRTTDIAVVVGGSQIDHEKSGTQNVGVLDVYKALRDLIRSKYEIDDDGFSIQHLDEAVRSGKIEIWGAEDDISDLVRNAIYAINGKIEREVERRLGSAAAMAAVVFVGGGATLFQAIPKGMRNGVLPDDPEFSNARGLWKLARLQTNNEDAA